MNCFLCIQGPRMIRLAFFLCFVFLPAGLFSQAAGIDILVTKPLNDTVFIGYYQGSFEKTIFTDTLLLSLRKGVLLIENRLLRGVYFLKNGEITFPFLMPSNQEFTLKADFSGFSPTFTVEGSRENKDFLRFLQMKPDAEGGNTEEELARLEELYRGDYLGKLMHALSEVRMPEPPDSLAGTPEEMIFRIQGYVDHYFDAFDYTDPELFRSPLYDDKVLSYLENVLPLFPDTVISRTDRMLERTASRPEVFQHLASLLFRYYRNSDYVMAENIWVHMAEKWFLSGAVEGGDSLWRADLSREVSLRKPNLIGAEARDIELFMHDLQDFESYREGSPFPEGRRVMLRNMLTARINLLFFWEPGCSYCLEAAPLLFEQLQSYNPLEVQVIAMLSAEYPESLRHWAMTLKSLGLKGWIHVRTAGSSRYKWDYNILNTPCIYLLDSKGKILLKNISPEETANLVNLFLKS